MEFPTGYQMPNESEKHSSQELGKSGTKASYVQEGSYHHCKERLAIIPRSYVKTTRLTSLRNANSITYDMATFHAYITVIKNDIANKPQTLSYSETDHPIPHI